MQALLQAHVSSSILELLAQVIEDGLDGSYSEDWVRLPESKGSTAAFRLKGTRDASRSGFLVIAGDCFHFAASRAAQLEASGKKLAEVFSGMSL